MHIYVCMYVCMYIELIKIYAYVCLFLCMYMQRHVPNSVGIAEYVHVYSGT